MGTLENLVSEFLADGRGRGLSPKTVVWYGITLRQFADFARSRGVDGLGALEPGLLRQYVGASLAEISPGGTHARLRAVRALCGYLVTEEVLEANPFNRVKLPKVPERELAVVSADDFRALLGAAALGRNPLRDQAILALMFDTGMRASELCSIRREDLARAEGGIIIKKGKGGRVRFVPVSRQVMRRVNRYENQERPASRLPELLLTDANTPLSYPALRGILERHCEGAGLKPFRPHAFRRGFSVAYIQNGGDVFTLQRILGHQSLTMTGRYARMNTQDVKDAHLRASPVSRTRQ